jgi:hypothetical protein
MIRPSARPKPSPQARNTGSAAIAFGCQSGRTTKPPAVIWFLPEIGYSSRPSHQIQNRERPAPGDPGNQRSETSRPGSQAFFRPFPPRNYFRQLFTASPPKVKVFMVHFQTRNKANFPGPDHPEKSPEFD